MAIVGQFARVSRWTSSVPLGAREFAPPAEAAKPALDQIARLGLGHDQLQPFKASISNWIWICPGLTKNQRPQFHESSDAPSSLVDIKLHQAFVSHFQQEGLASFFIYDIGAFHDFVRFERLLSERPQDILSITQHDWTPTVIKRVKSLRVRKLIFRNYPLDILRLALDAISKTSIGLDGHELNDGVNHWWISCGTSLWTLGLVANVFIQLVGI
jgi:hypothetical protein